MNYVFAFLISFGASVIGVLCGVGGGIVIKPTMDMIGIVNVTTASFLSGCTVLAMTAYSTTKSIICHDNMIEVKSMMPLALGSAAGGVTGKALFGFIKNMLAYPDKIGAIQAVLLAIVSIGTMIYTLNRAKIKTLELRSTVLCALTGFSLGILSSFLGIGGGPINLMVLYYLFSMNTKTAAQNSLFIILFSQAFSLIYSISTGDVPKFSPALLLLMVVGGLAGGILGRRVNRIINAQAIDRLFVGFLGVIVVICAYNFASFE